MTQVCGGSLSGGTNMKRLMAYKLQWRNIRFKLISSREMCVLLVYRYWKVFQSNISTCKTFWTPLVAVSLQIFAEFIVRCKHFPEKCRWKRLWSRLQQSKTLALIYQRIPTQCIIIRYCCSLLLDLISLSVYGYGTCNNGADACWRSVTLCLVNSLAKHSLGPVSFLGNERERSSVTYVIDINSDLSQGWQSTGQTRSRFVSRHSDYNTATVQLAYIVP